MSGQKAEALGSALGEAAALNKSGERGWKSFTALAEGSLSWQASSGCCLRHLPSGRDGSAGKGHGNRGKIGNLAVQSIHHSHEDVMCTAYPPPKAAASQLDWAVEMESLGFILQSRDS